MLGATATVRGPEVAPDGTVIVIEVPLQASTVAAKPLRRTSLLLWEVPKPRPEMVTEFPGNPTVDEREEIVGAGDAVVLTETLSNVAVTRVLFVVSLLLTANPASTPVGIDIVWVAPTCVQVTPS